MTDLMTLVPDLSVPCLDKGFVRLVDVMPRLVDDGQTADAAVVQAARVSYGAGTKSVSDDRDLIRYLMRHRHTKPFEAVKFKFHWKAPLVVVRQIDTHRTASKNEMSGRYSEMADEFYIVPERGTRLQSKSNKQGGEEPADAELDAEFNWKMRATSDTCHNRYEDALKLGVAREQARMLLPLNLYTEFYWTIDLHNLLHFLALRCDSHAQAETREYANAVLKLVTPLAPECVRSWEDYHPMRGAVTLTRLEVEGLKKFVTAVGDTVPVVSSNKREQGEWVAKLKRVLGS